MSNMKHHIKDKFINHSKMFQVHIVLHIYDHCLEQEDVYMNHN
jgi:hypothetical protein